MSWKLISSVRVVPVVGAIVADELGVAVVFRIPWVGGSVCSAIGALVGETDGIEDELIVVTGSRVGERVGVTLGAVVGEVPGNSVKTTVGGCVDTIVGNLVGEVEGASVEPPHSKRAALSTSKSPVLVQQRVDSGKSYTSYLKVLCVVSLNDTPAIQDSLPTSSVGNKRRHCSSPIISSVQLEKQPVLENPPPEYSNNPFASVQHCLQQDMEEHNCT